MRVPGVLLAVLAALAGCGTAEPEDRTAGFVSCLELGKGTVVERPAQLADFPTAGAEYSTGFSLESVAFDTIDVEVGDKVHTLVLVNRPQIPQPASNRATDPAELIRRAQRGERTGARQLVILPPTAGAESVASACVEAVAGDQIYP
ncbi:hypothetical protein OJ997_22150 [Solirubrobacter phytolaccae]|uniref:Uncharacterized protein n=1 Tax=Solirubrobacter phytolaccae TaxID=1404360 RepID=A0A9X3NKF2_9ACTN|nr:hypothetical protein [Solirubrobacter phytolaccae]MDA0183027.1 hypothetical protein [Solirubrobacter phytolaccae]